MVVNFVNFVNYLVHFVNMKNPSSLQKNTSTAGKIVYDVAARKLPVNWSLLSGVLVNFP